jgi:hypothetical protein
VTGSEFARVPKLARGPRLGDDIDLDQVPRGARYLVAGCQARDARMSFSQGYSTFRPSFFSKSARLP